MRSARRRRPSWLIVLVLSLALAPFVANAFLPLIFSAGRIGAYVGAAIPSGMRAAGYAARDPRIVTTVAALGRGLAARISSLGQTLTSLPWAKTAAYSGLGTVGAVGGAYGIVQGTKWIFSDDPESVVVQQEQSSQWGDPPEDRTTLPKTGYSTEVGLIREGPFFGFLCLNSTCSDIRPYQVTTAPCPDTSGSCSPFFPYDTKDVNGNFSGPAVAGQPFWRYSTRLVLPVGSAESGWGATWIWMPPAGQTEVPPPPGGKIVETTMPLDQALESLTSLSEDELDQPLDDAWLAGIANSVHFAGTLGANGDSDLYWPWAPSNPLVTPSDVSRIFAENPDLSRPLVRDLAEAIAPDGASTVPLPVPEQYQPSAGTGGITPPIIPVNPGGVQVDFGSDPNVGAPSLEEIPTAQAILQPLLDLWPDLRDADFSVGVGECPIARFVLFGSEQVMDSHCTLLEANRESIAVAMVLAWSILALGIVLRA